VTLCRECGQELHIGDYPFCPHGSIYEQNAQRFDAIVVWQHNSEPDKYSFPGHANESCPADYHRVEITNLREADRFVTRMNAIERAKMVTTRDLNYQALDEQTKRRREDIAARIRGNAKMEALFRQAREWTDRSKERKRSRHRSLDPHFHIQVLSYDSGNRNSYAGPETSWREQKK